jgi:hypothetical protein
VARIRPIYSESHDRSLFPQQSRKGKRRKGVAQTQIPQPPIGTPPPTNIGFLPKNLSEEQRVSLRARQLLAERQVRPLPLEQIKEGGPIERPPVPDHDIQYDDDLDVRDPRGEQYNLVDGKTPFPNILGPRPDREFMRILSEEDVHPASPDFDSSTVNASKELIAAVSADDQTILAMDNELTILHTTLRRLRQKAERMAQSVRRQDDDPGNPDSPTSHADNVVQMLTRILEPWFNALDDEFNKMLEGTQQGEIVQEGGLGGA